MSQEELQRMTAIIGRHPELRSAFSLLQRLSRDLANLSVTVENLKEDEAILKQSFGEIIELIARFDEALTVKKEETKVDT